MFGSCKRSFTRRSHVVSLLLKISHINIGLWQLKEERRSREIGGFLRGLVFLCFSQEDLQRKQ